MQEAQIRKLRGQPCGPMPNRERDWWAKVLAIERMSKPVRRTRASGLRGEVGASIPITASFPAVSAAHWIMSSGSVEAIELRQSQRAAVPLQRGETARFAFPTGFESEEAQVFSLYLDAFSVMFVLQ